MKGGPRTQNYAMDRLLPDGWTADSELSDVSDGRAADSEPYDGRAADSELRDERAEVREERATGVEEDNLSTGIRELGMLTFVE